MTVRWPAKPEKLGEPLLGPGCHRCGRPTLRTLARIVEPLAGFAAGEVVGARWCECSFYPV